MSPFLSSFLVVRSEVGSVPHPSTHIHTPRERSSRSKLEATLSNGASSSGLDPPEVEAGFDSMICTDHRTVAATSAPLQFPSATQRPKTHRGPGPGGGGEGGGGGHGRAHLVTLPLTTCKCRWEGPKERCRKGARLDLRWIERHHPRGSTAMACAGKGNNI